MEILTLLKSILVLMGVVLIVPGFIGTYLGYQSMNWPTAQGVVTHSSISIGQYCRATCSPTYAPNITYNYSVQGVRYAGHLVSLDLVQGSVGSYGSVSSIVSQYPQGSNVAVHYNPSSPAEAVLATGISIESLAMLVIGIILTAVGVYSLFLPRKYSGNPIAPK
ncbi:MAG: DUF3592 domain-containing protein [Candidatus Micrarchaeota archaeon]|nr:DUF3592 domain-containing protein [Candidatus Micrarchaeota archaeon]